jgi:hypothetical protein
MRILSTGRNDPCHCGSEIKYKRCCLATDEQAWRVVSEMMKDAVALAATLPKSTYEELNPWW